MKHKMLKIIYWQAHINDVTKINSKKTLKKIIVKRRTCDLIKFELNRIKYIFFKNNLTDECITIVKCKSYDIRKNFLIAKDYVQDVKYVNINILIKKVKKQLKTIKYKNMKKMLEEHYD
jgi:hypothetical protein